MAYKVKNITHLLDKKDSNHNKTVIIKVNKNYQKFEYKILPYQEIIFDSKLLPIEIKKMEILGMIQCIPLSNNYMDVLNNPSTQKKTDIEVKKESIDKKKKITKQKPQNSEDIIL